MDKLRKKGQVPKALNHTRTQDAGKEYKLPLVEAQDRLEPQTREVSCLIVVRSDLTIRLMLLRKRRIS